MAPTDLTTRSLQKGSAEFLVLAILDGPQRHGYEIAQLIAERSESRLKFQAATLYPLLYKLEERGLVVGRWIEKPGERRRRFYRLTAEGRRALGSQRRAWRSFFEAVERVGQLGRA
jgi:transcriptional regulator